jgi:hypothetical protein
MKMTVFWDIAECSVIVSYKLTDVSEVLTTSIIIALMLEVSKMSANFSVIVALMMKRVSTCETLVGFYETTRRNIPENSHLYPVS